MDPVPTRDRSGVNSLDSLSIASCMNSVKTYLSDPVPMRDRSGVGDLWSSNRGAQCELRSLTYKSNCITFVSRSLFCHCITRTSLFCQEKG